MTDKIANGEVAKIGSTQEHVKALEGIVDTLTDDVVAALDIKEEKKSLEDNLMRLREERAELQDVVKDLTTTRDRLQSELQKKEGEQRDMKMKVDGLKEENAELESDQVGLETQVKHLTDQTDKMRESLELTNDLLVKLKHEVKSFDNEIRA